MLVPLDARASKFSVSGTPSAVMLPPLVVANDGCVMREEPAATLIRVTAIAALSGRKMVKEREDRDEDVVFMGQGGGIGHVPRATCSVPRVTCHVGAAD